jgi:4-amino-4-deoxy-L-arabinose transferase-like glycosyltransferase
MSFQKIFAAINRRKFQIAITVILLLGFFLRAYHFGDWLHFETDQTDDYLITAPAIENGIGNLKLLGPRAGAEELRIGPAYYYLEYLGGKIFGNTPQGHAMPNLILAILSLPLFFLFARLYFSRSISLAMLSLYSISFYLIQYARFSWNPNVLPFFVLATFYSLLRSISNEEKKRNIFFIISLTLLSIITQLHFNGMFIIAPAFVLFLIYKRPKFSIRTWVLAVFFATLIYAPVIAHEIKYDWSNSKLLIKKISGGSSNEKRNVPEKIIQNLRYNSGEFFLILTGQDNVNTSRPEGYSLGITCKTCQDDLPWRLSAIIFYLGSLLLLIWNIFKEKDLRRKDFLIISALWLLIGSAYFISLTLNKLYMYPRFYLVLAPLTFVFVGLILEKIHFKRKLINNLLILFVVLLVAKLNSGKIIDSFQQLKNSEKTSVIAETEDVFPNYYRTPLFVHQDIANYIEQKVPDKNTNIFIFSESEYEPIYWILLKKKGYHYFDQFSKEKTYTEGKYFSIQISANKKKNDLSQFSKSFDIIETKDFGILNVVQLQPKNGISIDAAQMQTRNQIIAVEKMHSWKDLFQK